jgi:hypothetical protein
MTTDQLSGEVLELFISAVGLPSAQLRELVIALLGVMTAEEVAVCVMALSGDRLGALKAKLRAIETEELALARLTTAADQVRH